MNETKSNVFDKLLYYLSHEGELSWGKFKDAINRLTDNRERFEYSTYLKSLARLGHIDFNPLKLSHVAIAPAVVVETAVEDRYVLVGSRIPDFLEEIKKCVSGTGGEFQSISERYAPATIVLSKLTGKAFSYLESLGVHISQSFSARLSSLLPCPKRTSFPQIKRELPDSLRKFNLDTLEYEIENHSPRNEGLYEIPQYGPDVYILKSGSDQRKVPRDWGEWLALSTSGRTTGLISYEKKSQKWCVKTRLLVPLILDRCATLCSGFPPKGSGSFVCYSDVPAGIAYRLTKSLYQEDWEVA